MYRKYGSENDYSKWTDKSTVYKCRKDIECENGFFESGSYIMLYTCSADLEKLYVIDFISVCRKVKSNPYEYSYTNNIETKTDVLWDTVDIPVNMLADYFEKADEVNQGIERVNKIERKISVICLVLAVLIFALFCFEIASKSMEIMTGITITMIVIAVSVCIFSYVGIKKINNTFCDSIIFGSDIKK